MTRMLATNLLYFDSSRGHSWRTFKKERLLRKPRLILVLLAIALAAFVACGSGSNGDADENTDAAPSPQEDFDAFCAAAQDFARAIGSAGEDPDFEGMTTALAAMEASAPEEIRADVTTVKEALSAGLENADGNPLTAPEVQEANDRIFEYLGKSECEPPDDV